MPCMLQGRTISAGEKLASLFESHTRIILGHEAGKPAGLGRKPRLDEVKGELITGSKCSSRVAGKTGCT